MNQFTLSQAEFNGLFNPDITTISEQDRILEKIEQRIGECLKSILNSKKEIDWCYSPSYCSECYRSFDVFSAFIEDKKYINVSFEPRSLKEPYFNDYRSIFDVSWLWNKDYKEEYDKKTSDFAKRKLEEEKGKKQLLENKKLKKQQLIEAAKSKLTKEELKLLRVK